MKKKCLINSFNAMRQTNKQKNRTQQFAILTFGASSVLCHPLLCEVISKEAIICCADLLFFFVCAFFSLHFQMTCMFEDLFFLPTYIRNCMCCTHSDSVQRYSNKKRKEKKKQRMSLASFGCALISVDCNKLSR